MTPLWAVVTAWLCSDAPPPRAPTPPPPFGRALDTGAFAAECWRAAMCLSCAALLAAPEWSDSSTWIPLAVATWACALAGDAAAGGVTLRALVDFRFPVVRALRRALATLLTFHYVCLAWVFFRASSFANALAILRQLARAETDHANLVPIVMCALAVGFLCHFFADGSFRWLRERFAALPPWAQGGLLAAVALILRELSHTKVVPFIYFQF